MLIALECLHHRTPPEEALGWVRSLGALVGADADCSLWLRLDSAKAITRWQERDQLTVTVEQAAYLQRVDDENQRHLSASPRPHPECRCRLLPSGAMDPTGSADETQRDL